jgi:hypothetical protein
VLTHIGIVLSVMISVGMMAGCETGGLAVAPNAERQSAVVLVDDPTKLDVCLFPATGLGGSGYERELMEGFVRYAGNGGSWLSRVGEPYFRSVQTVTSLDDQRDCDVTVRISHPGFTVFTPTIVDVYSTRTKGALLHFEVTSAQRSHDLATPVRDAFVQKGRLYQRLLAERQAEQVPATGPAAPRIVSDVDRPLYGGAPRPAAYAVVVGIEQYQQKLPNADFAAHDAEIMGQYLTKTLGYAEENVVVLLNNRATKTGVEKYIEHWLPNRVEKDASVFIYYSGHGAPNPKTGDAYLMPYDGDPAFVDATGYPLKRLYEHLDKLSVKEVVVMLDSCFSGAGDRSVIAPGTRPMVLSVENPLLASGKTVVLAASAGDQISSSYKQKGHGLLTYFFLKGLQGEADTNKDGGMDLSELFDYVKPQVSRVARREFNNEQTPQLLGNPDLLRRGVRLVDRSGP